MDELLKRLYGLIQPRDTLQAATSPLTVPQMGMLNRLLGLSRGQAETAIEKMPQQLAESRQMLENFTPGQPIDPKLLDQFMNLAGFGPAGITAYHGSPYLFRQFNPSKMGTGEGAQAYGAGAGYTAEAQAVAKDYQKRLADWGSPYTYEFQGQKFYDPSLYQPGKFEHDPVSHAVRLTYHQGKQTATQIAKQGMEAAKAKEPFAMEMGGEQYYQTMLDTLKNIKKSDIKATQGFLYKGDIPDEILPKFLDWDKPISQQSKEIQDIAAQFAIKTTPSGLKEARGSDLYKAIAGAKAEPPFDTSKEWSSYKAATDYLESMGVPGIRYLDQGSRDAGKGTSNFIPFRAEDYKIQQINDIPLEDWISKGLL